MTLQGSLLDPMRDHFGLIELFETVFGHTVSPAMWYWKYVPKWTNRHYCYVGRVDDKVIGYFGAVPLRGTIDGVETPFFQLADFMVHPDYRLKYDYFGLGSDRILKDIQESHKDHLVYGFSGHRAFRFLERAKLAGFIGKAQTRYKRLDAVPETRQFEFVELPWKSDEIDAAWEKHRDYIKAGLIRDGDYLRWRYGTHPVNNYRLIGVCRDGEAIGWVVIGADKPGDRDRAKEIPIVDMLLPQQAAADVAAELAGYLENSVMCWIVDRLAEGFDEKKDSGTHCYHFVKESVRDTEFLRDNLYYTMGDVDWW
jgi:GNAT superfamily N-acetyltransferase